MWPAIVVVSLLAVAGWLIEWAHNNYEANAAGSWQSVLALGVLNGRSLWCSASRSRRSLEL